MKKIKKLVLEIDTISNLTDEKMENINGGGGCITSSCYAYCQGISNYDNCGSLNATGTGYGMCCCNATGNCAY